MKRSENGQTPYQLDQLCPLCEPHFLDWFPTFTRVLSEPHRIQAIDYIILRWE